MSTKERICKLLYEKEMTQVEVAKKAGINRQSFANFIYDRHLLRLDAAVAVATVLDVSLSYLIGLTDKRGSDEEKYNMDVNVFPIRLREIMRAKGIDEKGLAEKAQIGTSTIYQYYYGIRLPQLGTLISISKALNVSIDFLLHKEGVSGV